MQDSTLRRTTDPHILIWSSPRTPLLTACFTTIPAQRSRIQLLSIAGHVAWPTLPWKTPPEMAMLSTTGSLTSLSYGRGHAGKELQHSHAGGSHCMAILSTKDITTFPRCFGSGLHRCPHISVTSSRSSALSRDRQQAHNIGATQSLSGNILPEAGIPCPLSPPSEDSICVKVRSSRCRSP